MHSQLSQHYPGLVPPRQATPRDYTRATYGDHTAAAAAMLGTPLLPWQKYVADVAGEITEDGSFAYGTIVVTVQRQAGKTTLDLANDIQNCLMGPKRRVWYTAQSGQHASDKWLEMAEAFEKSPLKLTGKVRRSNGTQMITFANGSTVRPHPPTADSLHSKQSDKNTIDEAWFFNNLQANALKQAIVPTTTTRRKKTGHRPQLWVLSTEGTLESEYLNALLKQCREACPPGTAFFDFGIDPAIPTPNVDKPAELEAFMKEIAAAHPGYKYLFEMTDLYGFLNDLGLSEFLRAYGNRRTGATERVIPEADWNAASTVTMLPEVVCFGAAVGMDGIDAAITATGIVNGVKISEVVDWRPGSGHAFQRCKELFEKHGAPFAIDSFGPSADLYDKCKRAGIPLIELKTSSVSAACSQVYSGVVRKGEPAIWMHRPDEWNALNDAAEVAAKRSVGDGAWVWGRRASVGSTAAVEAASMGTWGIDHMPEVAGIQIF